MPLKKIASIAIPDARNTQFDHGAFDPKTRRVFIAHTARDRLEVIDHDRSSHLASLAGFKEAAGVIADDGQVLVTNRGDASLAWVDGTTLRARAVFPTGPRPNGVAIVSGRGLAIVGFIGDDHNAPELQVLRLDGQGRWSLALPGRPRWCVTDSAGDCVFIAIREPSMVLSAELPELGGVKRWMLPSTGAHGLDIDHERHRLYVACDGGALVQVDSTSGTVAGQWPLAGAPDATWFNPSSGLVHVAIEQPGVVQSIDPEAGVSTEFQTGSGAKTTALVGPRTLYVFSPAAAGALVLAEV